MWDGFELPGEVRRHSLSEPRKEHRRACWARLRSGPFGLVFQRGTRKMVTGARAAALPAARTSPYLASDEVIEYADEEERLLDAADLDWGTELNLAFLGAERGRPPAPNDPMVARARDRRRSEELDLGGPRGRTLVAVGEHDKADSHADRPAACARDPGRRGGGDRRRWTPSGARAWGPDGGDRPNLPSVVGNRLVTFPSARRALLGSWQWLGFPEPPHRQASRLACFLGRADAQVHGERDGRGRSTPRTTRRRRVKQPGDPDFLISEPRGVRCAPAPARGGGRGRARSPSSPSCRGRAGCRRNAAHSGERRQQLHGERHTAASRVRAETTPGGL